MITVSTISTTLTAAKAITGALSGFASGALTGGLEGGLRGAAMGGAFGVIHGLPLGGFRPFAHGLAGGGLSKAYGGEFRHGALGAFVPAFFAPGINSIPGGGIGGVFARSALAGTIGGVSANLAGGRFWNGFQTGAFGRLFNHEASIKFIGRIPAILEKVFGFNSPHNRGIAIGLSVTFPGKNGGEFNLALTREASAGEALTIGKGAVSVGYTTRSTVDSLEGDGGELSIHAAPAGASWVFDGNGNLIGSSFNMGPGLGVGAYGTQTEILWRLR